MATTVGQHSVAAFTSPVNGTTPIDANSVRGNDNTVRSAYVDHDADPGIHVQSSTLASRPAAGTAGRKWITEDSGVYTLWFDDGTNWHPVSSENINLTVLATETLVKGDVVKVTGWNNGQDLPEVAKVSSTSDTAFAIITANVANGAMGYATNTGIVQDLATNSFSVGNILYPNSSGWFTATKPTSGNYQAAAYVLRSNANNGVLYVEFSAPRIVERSDNTASTIVLRDASGNFSAGTITAGALTSTGLVTFASLKGTGATTVTNILDEDNMASDSATALATQQSIKAYVDAKVATVDTLAEVLANGNTTGANNIIVSSGQKITTNTIDETTSGAGVTIDSVLLKDDVVNATDIETGTISANDGTLAITVANSTGALTLASALADSNLATISTAGKVSNSATTATSSNTASAIVARDASGNFTAGTITATLSGTATQVSQALTAGTYLTSGGTYNGSTARTFAVDATDANTASKVVARDASGNFAAGTITATLNGAAPAGSLSGSTLASGVTASSLTSVGTLTSLTVSGDLTVDTSTLVVASGNNSVGVGTASPGTSVRLNVAGSVNLSGTSFTGQGSPTIFLANTTATTGRTMAINSLDSGGLQFYDVTGGGATRLTLDGSGNLAVDTNTLYVDAANNKVGIVNASPNSFTVGQNDLVIGAGNAITGLTIYTGTTNNGTIAFADGTTGDQQYRGFVQYNHSTDALSLGTTGATRATIDTSGNLGLGVTPSAWDASYKTITVNGFSVGSQAASGGSELTKNSFVSSGGTQKYVENGFATKYEQVAGQHKWYYAASGTAGNTITFTQAMTLDASGNLGVGVTPTEAFCVKRGASTAAYGEFAGNNNTPGSTSALYGQDAGGNAYAWNRANLPLLFGTNNTERARIDASGNLGLGATPSAWTAIEKAIEISRAGNGIFSGGIDDVTINSNAYYAGAWKFGANGYANRFNVGSGNGQFQWFVSTTSNSSGAGANASFTQAMTLDANARLAINTTTFAGNDQAIIAFNSAGTYSQAMNIRDTNASANGGVFMVFRKSNDTYLGNIRRNSTDDALYVGGNSYLALGSGDTERARITSGGYFKASNNGAYYNSAGTFHEIAQSAGDTTAYFVSTATSGAEGIVIRYNNQAPNGTGNIFLNCVDSTGGGTQRAAIRSNGGLANYQSNNVDLSDIRTKTDITPAASMWDKVAALEIVAYKYIDQTHDDVNLGVIAQQVETVEPVWVDSDGFGETPDGEEPLRTVYTKDITFAAIKALQEAMARIEALEARLEALEA